MHNIFLEHPKTILSEWKNVRNQIHTKDTINEQLKLVFDFWRMTPIHNSVILDWDSPKDWPDPWTMIYENKYDESMVALGMFYTLAYASNMQWDHRIYLALITDESRSFQNLAVIIDKCYLLNLSYMSPIEMNNPEHMVTVYQKYQYNDKTHVIV
jgi:hypothetical protein